MKYIIIGQIMLWANAIIITVAYFIFQSLNLGDYMKVYLGILGAVTGFANFGFSVALQVHGYQIYKIIPYDGKSELK